MKKLALYTVMTALAVSISAQVPAQAAVRVIMGNGNAMNFTGNCVNGQLQNGQKLNLEQLIQDIMGSNEACEEGKLPGHNGSEQNKPENNTPEEDNTTSGSYIQQVIDLVNNERAKAGLSPLKESLSAAQAADVRAREIATSFSHTRPDGTSFSTALSQNGAAYRGAGENIAYGQRTPQEVMEGWMNSQGHRANILNANYTTIGVGYYEDANGTGYWTQLFTY